MTTHTSSLESMRSSATKILRQLWDFFKSHRNVILLILCIILIVLATFLVVELRDNAYTKFFTCENLIDGTLKKGTFCKGFGIPTENFTVIPPVPSQDLTIDLGRWKPGISRGGIFGGWTIPQNAIPLLPALAPAVKEPLNKVRLFVVWNIILALAVVSLVLTYIASKISGFIQLLVTPEGRKTVLTNISIWLFIFALFCGVFYFWIAPR